MQPEAEGKLKYGIGGLVLGALIAIIIGFAWGGWTTSKTTLKMNEAAVLASHAAICVAQFMKEPNHVEKLKEFEKISLSYMRGEFIESGGWGKMPGQEKADIWVCRACADGLELLIKK
jgi:hypothetical protein